ncbi:23S rRNA (uracil1939-C5)-methyltransferase [Zhongshania antarctica]|uniref:23S rRNA (Uracil1939-C5)-methyltransferase n=1 Tax=Zhongshania antarctica TaxID=641702 RepID=A0A840R825_9GAMM|nr:23S rRNA (uracil(1939)-C(5))-methyltransferase RlmD [Zhongshania antarctica]MBB5188532.1 23S rRNA (uracil1939-C5)-methyltransferase [Zhongshania antarctica]
MSKQRHHINTFKPAKKPKSALDTAVLKLHIDSLADDGRGVARHDNKVVFVGGVLPNETVDAQYVRRHKRYDEAKLLAVSTPAEQRVDAICPVYQRCGGCQLQHLKYPSQVSFKQERLQRVLAAASANTETATLPAAITGSEFGYRHRARLSYHNGVLGFKAQASHNLIGVESCPLLAAELNGVLSQSAAAIAEFLGDKTTAEVVLSLSDDGRVALKIKKEGFVDAKRSAVLAEKLVAPAFLHSIEGSKGAAWRGENAPLSYPVSEALSLPFQPSDFTQVNIAVNQQMIQQCMAWLKPESGELISDYFCGLGNFSLALASASARVIGVDVGKAMLRRANQQAETLGLAIEYRNADLFDAENIVLDVASHKVLLDPPRAGAKALCEVLAQSKTVQTIVYVSCDPATLARDLAILQEGGFAVADAVMADMFPQTYHLESLVHLTRN